MGTEKGGPNPEAASKDDDVARISAILADLLEIDVREIKPDTKLEDDLGADSLVYLELFEEIKDEFDLDIEMHQIQRYASKHRVTTVGEVASMIRRYQDEGAQMLNEPT